MLKTLGLLLKAGKATQTELFPTLPSYSRGLPTLTTAKCADACTACAEICPTEAIDIEAANPFRSIWANASLAVNARLLAQRKQ
jgi:formate hydrogenlyase subunit 6/NADH:ubiquinone oxidoreductase subunit I